MRRWLRLVLVFVFVCIMAACGEPPDREMDEARSAIDAARAVGAEAYAGDEYRAAVAAFTLAQDAVGLRDYRLALNHALDSRERAQSAATQATDHQTALRSLAESTLGETKVLLDQARQRLAAAEAARVARRTLAASRAAIDAADGTVQKAGAAIVEGEFRDSRQRLSELGEQLRATIVELDAAIEARAPQPRG